MKRRDTEALKNADAATYDNVAQRFAGLTEQYSHPIARRMLDLGEAASARNVLDVGTGTGLVARLAAELCPDVLGIDHSAGMLIEARARAEMAGLQGRIRYQSMDAEALDLKDASFDLVVSLFVLKHLPRPDQAIREIFRVLRPGGKLVAAVGARADPRNLKGLKTIAGAVCDALLEKSGYIELAPTSLRTFLSRIGVNTGHFNQAAHSDVDVLGLLNKSGFTIVGQEWLGKRHVLDSGDFWDVQSIFDSAVRESLSGLDKTYLEYIKSSYIESIERTGANLVYRTGAKIFIAEKA